MPPAINSPGQPASLFNLNVLENWNNYQVAHLRSLQEPQGKWKAGGKTKNLPQHWPLGGPWNPLREEHVTQRIPPQLRPQTSELWHSGAGVNVKREDRGQCQATSPVHRTGSCLKVLIVESTRLHLNIISVDGTWRGPSPPCRQNFVRLEIA